MSALLRTSRAAVLRQVLATRIAATPARAMSHGASDEPTFNQV